MVALNLDYLWCGAVGERETPPITLKTQAMILKTPTTMVQSNVQRAKTGTTAYPTPEAKGSLPVISDLRQRANPASLSMCRSC